MKIIRKLVEIVNAFSVFMFWLDGALLLLGMAAYSIYLAHETADVKQAVCCSIFNLIFATLALIGAMASQDAWNNFYRLCRRFSSAS